VKNKTAEVLRGANIYGVLEDTEVQNAQFHNVKKTFNLYKNSETTIVWTF